jgi:putative ABC transport system substrate-binding protein
VKRREFITLLGGAAATWPLAARAQQHPPMGVPSQSSSVRHPVIGFLYTILAAEYGFRRGLNETGFVEGTNLAIDYRSLAGQFDRLSQLAADLAGRNVAAIICIDNDPATRAAIAATRTIPIVFTTAGNPVELGFVSSWNRPGANVTGITTFGQELLPKRLELLREILPTATNVAVLSNPATGSHQCGHGERNRTSLDRSIPGTDCGRHGHLRRLPFKSARIRCGAGSSIWATRYLR